MPLQKAAPPCEGRTSSEGALDRRRATAHVCGCCKLLKTIPGLLREKMTRAGNHSVLLEPTPRCAQPSPCSMRLWHNLKTIPGLPCSPVALRFAWCLTLAPLQKAAPPCEGRTSSEDALDSRRATAHACVCCKLLKTIPGLLREKMTRAGNHSVLLEPTPRCAQPSPCLMRLWHNLKTTRGLP